jgi:hypothetical protein
MKFIKWLRPSFEDNDGKASYRRITAFVMVCLISYMVVYEKVQIELHFKVFLSLLITLLLLIGIVTTQNILTFFNKKSDENEK